MTIEIHQPRLEAMIEQRMASGHFLNVEDVLLQALEAAPLPELLNSTQRTGADLIAEQTETVTTQADTASRLASLDRFLERMAAHSDRVPILSDEALTRESFYQDHD